jgi:hypothetical protein
LLDQAAGLPLFSHRVEGNGAERNYRPVARQVAIRGLIVKVAGSGQLVVGDVPRESMLTPKLRLKCID